MKTIHFILTGLLVIILVVAAVSLCVTKVGAEVLYELTVKRFSDADAEMIAKTVWGEARGCSDAQKAAVVWCILNRVDSDRFPDTIESVVTAPGQFFGYSASNPVEEDILAMVIDALKWWAVESVMPSEYRVLPPEYLYFSGNGVCNTYTTEYIGGTSISP